jgi:hypothetical protein
MMHGSTTSRYLSALLGLGFILAVAGCQSDDAGGVLGTAGKDGPEGGTAAKPPEGKVLQSELVAYCPQIILREGTAYFSTYERGGDGDPNKVIYQASIATVTRSCSRAGGMLTIDVAAAGRVVPGPLGKPGRIAMPIRVVVVGGSEVLYTKLHKFEVDIASIESATQFVFSDPNATVPNPTANNLQVFVGFDEGPTKPAAQ